jgi:hypothetical protein
VVDAGRVSSAIAADGDANTQGESDEKPESCEGFRIHAVLHAALRAAGNMMPTEKGEPS